MQLPLTMLALLKREPNVSEDFSKIYNQKASYAPDVVLQQP
jgi:hypothetical protein